MPTQSLKVPESPCCLGKAGKPYPNHGNMINMVKLLPEDIITLDSQIGQTEDLHSQLTPLALLRKPTLPAVVGTHTALPQK